jgi:hypothetical protein
VVTITHDGKARLRSYELLADVFGQAPAPRAGSLEGVPGLAYDGEGMTTGGGDR